MHQPPNVAVHTPASASAQTGGLFVDVVSRSCIFVSETLHERFAIRRNNDCAECSEVVRSVAKVAAAERNAELRP